MSKNLEKKIEEGKTAVEKQITENVSLMHTAQNRDRALMMLGAVGAINIIAKGLSAQTIRGLQKIREEKTFEAFGFTRFDDFLNEFENSPMTYRQFNDREKLLEQEGDEVFDVLNNLRISHRQRKLLGAGNVELDGELVIVKTINDDGEESIEEIEIEDRQRLLQTLSALADQSSRLNKKAEQQKRQIEKQDSEIEHLIRNGSNSSQSLHFEHFVRAKSALSQLREHLETEVTLVEKEQKGELYLRELYAEFSKVRGAYGRNELRFDTPVSEENEFAEITSALNDDELAELMD